MYISGNKIITVCSMLRDWIKYKPEFLFLSIESMNNYQLSHDRVCKTVKI